MSEFEEQSSADVEPVMDLEEIEFAQISFICQKKCLRCRRVNLYIAVECVKCHGRFVFDKTARIDVPEESPGRR